VFTSLYALSPYIKQTCLVSKGLTLCSRIGLVFPRGFFLTRRAAVLFCHFPPSFSAAYCKMSNLEYGMLRWIFSRV
jgi:hypothetical protein